MVAKKKIGRPKKFDSPEQMQKAIDSYFKKCDGAFEWVMTKDGPAKLPSPDPYTVEGLCAVLDMDRATLLTYEKNESHSEFHNTVTRAKRKILADVATGSIKGRYNSNAAMFNMRNNFGYEEKQIHEVKQEDIFAGMTKDQIAEILSDDEWSREDTTSS